MVRLSAALRMYRSQDRSRTAPMKTYVQVAQIVVWLIAIVLIVSRLIDQSPWALLSGIGALTAVIMLVFKDSILGFVASVQLTTNDMVRRGDWIEMPRYGADGDVIDVSLNTVKVQNWDKTISTDTDVSAHAGHLQELERDERVRGAADQAIDQHRHEQHRVLR